MNILTYQKLPIRVQAVQVDTEDYDELCDIVGWCGGRAVDEGEHVIAIDTKEGTMFADHGDYIIKEPHPTSDRMFYPCKPWMFRQAYAPT